MTFWCFDVQNIKETKDRYSPFPPFLSPRVVFENGMKDQKALLMSPMLLIHKKHSCIIMRLQNFEMSKKNLSDSEAVVSHIFAAFAQFSVPKEVHFPLMGVIHSFRFMIKFHISRQQLLAILTFGHNTRIIGKIRKIGEDCKTLGKVVVVLRDNTYI